MQTLSGSMWVLVSWPGIKPGPSALGTQSLSGWITREVASSSSFSICLHPNVAVFPTFLSSVWLSLLLVANGLTFYFIEKLRSVISVSFLFIAWFEYQVHTYYFHFLTAYLFLNFFFLIFWPHGFWNLSSLTRDWTQVTAVKVPNESPNHWPARTFPVP